MDLEQREISAETISPYFEQYFGHKPTVIAASPGRVNLIGEHTDYNNGFVLPMALNNINVIAVAPSPTGKHRWIGALGEAMIEIDPADVTKPGDPFWSNYVRGVICMLERRGINVPAVDMLIDSNVPRGGGLSSSAAFEVSACTALAALCGADVTPTERALIGQATEHEFVNVPCGIMDQFISANGRKDHALMLDCKDLSYKLIPMTDPAVSVLVIDSAVKHSLADGGYAARRKNCEDACAILGVPSLREATLEMLEEKKDALGDLCYRRARHVIGENLRVSAFAEAVGKADWDAAGVAMRASHASLKDDFEVSCGEVDTLVSLADTIPSAASVYGARMTGGGFGGCIVALVKSEAVQQVAEEMIEAYRNALGIETDYLITRPGEGAECFIKPELTEHLMKQMLTMLGALALMSGTALAQEAAAAAPAQDALPLWEMIVFCVVVVGVIALGIWKSSDSGESTEEKEEKGAADYFLAGRGLSWWLVGFSLLAANISTEQFVGMSGQSADWLGLAIAGYEWLAAIVLVIVAFTFLPMLLKRGVFTIPQFLEERYNGVARVIMALVNLLILVGVPTAAVIYAGASVVSVYFDMSVTTGCLIIAGAATVYVYVGGLKACAWTDLIWGAALIVGGGVVAYFAIMALGAYTELPENIVATAVTTANTSADALASTGSQFCDGLSRMMNLNAGAVEGATNGIGGKLHMMRETSDPVMPWTVYLLGLWIPNFFYWGLNQYIMQRTLASKSLEEGQLGIVFAAFLKLLIPFVVIIPGILAYNLFREDLAAKADSNTAAIVQAAEDTGKKVIYDIAASRLVREDSAASSVDFIKKNLAAVGAADQVPALEAKSAELTAIPAKDIAAREAKAREILAIDKAATGAARANVTEYTVTTTLAAYQYDYAFATLLRKLLPGTGWAWFVLAALFGAVVSSLASMLNSASTLFTMDLYNKSKEVITGKPASGTQLVAVGKVGVLVCAVIATVVAPFLDNPAFGGIFTFIQEFQGFLSPGVLAVFLFGFFVPKCPRVFGWLGIVIGAVAYASFKWVTFLGCTGDSFLNRMGYSLIVVCVVGLILTIVNHLRGGEAVVLTDKGIIEMKTSGRAKAFGVAVIIATLVLYRIFW